MDMRTSIIVVSSPECQTFQVDNERDDKVCGTDEQQPTPIYKTQ
jgi:hypothetical protein